MHLINSTRIDGLYLVRFGRGVGDCEETVHNIQIWMGSSMLVVILVLLWKGDKCMRIP